MHQEKQHYSVTTLADFVGTSLGVSQWMPITQELVNAFAHCTGDYQWIHLDVERSQRESPFGGTVAHGYLMLSLVARFAMEIGVVPADAAVAISYGLDKVRFLTPVRVGARVRAEVTLIHASGHGQGRYLIKTRNTIEIEGQDRPALIAVAQALLTR